MKLLSPLNARSMNGPSMESLRSRRVFFLLPQQFRSLDICTEEALRTVSSTLVVAGAFCHTHTSRHSRYTKASRRNMSVRTEYEAETYTLVWTTPPAKMAKVAMFFTLGSFSNNNGDGNENVKKALEWA